MSPIQRRELENIVNAHIAAIVVLSRHLKWIKSSLELVRQGHPGYTGTMPDSSAKEKTKHESVEREAHEQLQDPDTDAFDRFMKKLTQIPKERTST